MSSLHSIDRPTETTEADRPARATRDRTVGLLVVALLTAVLAVELFVLGTLGVFFPL
jgi:hypothetical protein